MWHHMHVLTHVFMCLPTNTCTDTHASKYACLHGNPNPMHMLLHMHVCEMSRYIYIDRYMYVCK